MTFPDPRRAPAKIRTVPVSACPACGGSGRVRYPAVQDRLYSVEGIWSIRECHACQSLWLDLRPADEDLPCCYPETYFTHEAPSPEDLRPRLGGLKGSVRRHILATMLGYRFEGGPKRGTPVGWLASRVPTLATRATHSLGPLFPRWRDEGRLLDVGCGNGSYLALMRVYGWKVLGQDVDPVASQVAWDAHGVVVTTESLDALAARGLSFDVVTASHVVEHVLDPVAFLRAAAACLKPGGELLVVTPNAAALGHRLLGSDWYPLDPPRHLAVFSPEGLRAVAARAGLAGVRISSLSRKAAKGYCRALAVRRIGSFQDAAMTRADLWRAGAFAARERIASCFAPVGEELVLGARGARP